MSGGSVGCDERLGNREENTREQRTSVDKAKVEGKFKIVSNPEDKQGRKQQARSMNNIWRMTNN